MLCGLTGGLAAFAYTYTPSADIYSSEVIATGFTDPVAITRHPDGDLLVSEKGLHRVSRVHQRSVYPFLQTQFEVSGDVSIRAQRKGLPQDFWIRHQFNTPADLDINENGEMLVAESAAGGRLLQFEPFTDEAGLARVLSTPWMDAERGIVQVASGPEGYLAIASVNQRLPHMPSGAVAVRRPDGEWLLVDHGPFASFSSLAIDRRTGVLLVCEEREGSMTWYDIHREMEIHHIENVKGVRQAIILSSGETIASIEHPDGTWSVIEVDPLQKSFHECRGGLSRIGGLFASREAPEFYIALRDEGLILRMERVNTTGEVIGNRTVELKKKFEMTHYLAPREWPEFFKAFVKKLGLIEPVDDTEAALDGAGSDSRGRAMTMGRFSQSVPMVAAKMRATLISGEDPDPLTEVSFVLFNPNRSTVTKNTIAPSISLFRAVSRDGKNYRTRFLPNGNGQPVSELLSWSELPDMLVSFPAGYYAKPTATDDPNMLRVYFLGVGLGPDYWFTIPRDNLHASELRVEKTDGTRLIYQLEPYQDQGEGELESVLVAGLTRISSEWVEIGRGPVRSYIVHEGASQASFRHMPRVKELFPDMQAMTDEFFGDSSDSWELDSEEIDFRRSVIVRSATRW